MTTIALDREIEFELFGRRLQGRVVECFNHGSGAVAKLVIQYTDNVRVTVEFADGVAHGKAAI